MKTRFRVLVTNASFLLLLSACASESSLYDENTASERVCVQVRSISSFNGLSDREVFVTAGVKNHYLFTVSGICMGLEQANAIGIADQSGRICGDGFGSIVFRDMGRNRRSCKVRNIEHVVDGAQAREWVDAREAERRGKN